MERDEVEPERLFVGSDVVGMVVALSVCRWLAAAGGAQLKPLPPPAAGVEVGVAAPGVVGGVRILLSGKPGA